MLDAVDRRRCKRKIKRTRVMPTRLPSIRIGSSGHRKRVAPLIGLVSFKVRVLQDRVASKVPHQTLPYLAGPGSGLILCLHASNSLRHDSDDANGD